MELIDAIPRSASRLYGDQNCCCSVSIGLVSPGVDGWPGTVSGAIIIVSGGAVAGGGGAGLTSSTAGVCSSLSRWSPPHPRSEEHTSELQSRGHLVCRLLLEKQK